MPFSIASLLLATLADFSSRCFCSLEMAELIPVEKSFAIQCLISKQGEDRSGKGLLHAMLLFFHERDPGVISVAMRKMMEALHENLKVYFLRGIVFHSSRLNGWKA